jgi:hypothetical protein
MSNARQRLTLLVLFVVGTSLTLRVQGAIVSGPFATTTPIPLTLTDWTSSLAFPQFNPSLGTLLSVQLDLSGSFQTLITVTNTSNSSSSGTAKTEVMFTVQDAGNNLIAPEIDILSPSFAYSLPPSGFATSGLLIKNGSSSDLYTLPAVLAEFTGVGSVVLPASTFTQTLLANTGGNTFAGQSTNASLTGTVTYTYEVPEPGTLLLAGISALGLVTCGRTRRRSTR